MNKLYALLVRSGPFRSGAVRCSLNSNFNQFGKIVCGSKSITIPAWSSGDPVNVDVDFTDVIPAGHSFYAAFIGLNNTILPYVDKNGKTLTWVRTLSGKKISINSIDTGGWNSYTLYYALILLKS